MSLLPSAEFSLGLTMKKRCPRLPARRIIPLALASAVLTMSQAATPPTDKKPVTDEYHGVKVVDDYRWLETAGTPEVKVWTEAQNRRTRAYLDAVPERPAL